MVPTGDVWGFPVRVAPVFPLFPSLLIRLRPGVDGGWRWVARSVPVGVILPFPFLPPPPLHVIYVLIGLSV